MLSRLKGFFLKNNIIIWNIFSLWTLQIFNYIIPLITLPYILRVLWQEKYWTIVFYGAFISYFLIFINYWFNYSATKNISIYRDNKDKISEIFWSIFFIKIIFWIISAVIVVLITFLFERFSREYLIILFSFLSIFGEILFPIWFFQWIEKMKYITLIHIIVKLIFLIPIFIFIKWMDDYVYLPLITSISVIISWFIAFITAIKIAKVVFIIPTAYSIQNLLVDWWHIFISTIFISLYTTSTTFILWLFVPPVIVGYYASAEKLVRAFQWLIWPISQAIYPTIAKKLKVSHEKTIVFLKKLAILVSISMLLVSCFLFFWAEFLVKIIFWSQFEWSISIIKILSFLPLIVWINTIYSNLIMLNFWFQKAYSTIYISVSILSVFLSLSLIYSYASVWLAISVLFTECLLLLLVYIYLLKKWIRLI